MRFRVDTEASPEQVLRALTDFSPRRLQTWRRTLDPARYEVRDQGPTWAVAREASPRSPFWVVARYDWSRPREVRWTVEDSSYGGTGRGCVRIEEHDGGSRLDVEWDNTGARPVQRPLLFLLHRGATGRVLARLWASALDRYAQDDRG